MLAMKKIVQEGAPILREVAKPVPEKLFGTPELAAMIRDMQEALDAQEDGVALAAPQIALPYRIFVARLDRTRPPPPAAAGAALPQAAPEREVFINPEIFKTSRKRHEVDEGCLSVRGVYGKTLRHERVSVRARRLDGASFTRGGGDVLAQLFEHEVDHLNGILFIDHAQELLELAQGEEHHEPVA
jgi:peptide deformylase